MHSIDRGWNQLLKSSPFSAILCLLRSTVCFLKKPSCLGLKARGTGSAFGRCFRSAVCLTQTFLGTLSNTPQKYIYSLAHFQRKGHEGAEGLLTVGTRVTKYQVTQLAGDSAGPLNVNRHQVAVLFSRKYACWWCVYVEWSVCGVCVCAWCVRVMYVCGMG